MASTFISACQMRTPAQEHLPKTSCLKLAGIDTLLIPLTEIRDPRMYRMHGLGRMIRFEWKEKTVFITVVRINFFGYFAIIDFFRTGQVFKALSLSTTSA